MSAIKLFFSVFLLFISTNSFGQVVNTPAELNSAINAATPGAIIQLADGTWNDVFIDIDKDGTVDQPIIITAQNQGAVFMTGNSRVHMEGAYLTVSGLIFQDPANLVVSNNVIEPVIELRNCNNCKVLQNKIDTYNGTEAQKALKFKWILADGPNNEIAFNSFIGKYGVGSIINDNRNSTAPDYLKIHHNYFADRTPINEVNADNDQDAIRIGNSGTSLDDSFSEVYANYFFNFIGEIEVISNKSGKNKYYNNTFRDYSGTLTLRHGNDCEVFGNYFIANDYFLSGGVRVIGENHKIYNNYIEGVNSKKPNGSTSNATGGINVTNGRMNSELSGYYQVKNTQIVNNTFVNCDYGLRIGTQVSSDLSEAPENLVLANNIMYNSSINSLQIVTSPTGSSVSSGNTTNLPSSAMEDDGEFHRLTSGSSPIDNGTGNYSYVTQDVLGGDRDSDYDRGAEEFGADGTNFPYNSDDVGVRVGFGGVLNAISTSLPSLDFGVCGNTITFEVASNVDWEITENIPWLTLDINAGSGNALITATTTENTSGVERTGSLSINEVAGGNGLTSDLSVVQLNTSIAFDIPINGTTSLGMQDIPAVAEVNAYNDDLTNYWTGDPDTEPEVSITFDLEQLHFLSKIGINFWKADERTTTFTIEVAEDAAGPFTTIIDNGISADAGVTVETEQLFNLNGTLGRYVKFIGIGNSSATNWTSIANVNIYGDVNCASFVSSINQSSLQDAGISIFPVPVYDGLLNITSNNKPFDNIEIYSISGQRILSLAGTATLSKQIDISQLSSGIYILNLVGFGQSKIVVP